MKLETFFEKFDQFADAPDAVAKMRELVLNLAVQGKLLEQNPSDESATELLERLGRELTPEQRRRKAAPLSPLSAETSHYELPDGWAWAHFREVAIIASNLVKPDEFLDFTHLAPDNIEKGKGVLLPCRTVREDKVISSNHRFYPGQIVYSKIRPNLAKVVVVDFEDLCSADMYPIDALIDAFYLQIYMLSESFLVQAVKTDTRVAMPKINQTELNAIAVPVPPLAEQRRIVAKVDELMALCDRLEVQQQERETRHAVLARASLARFADAPTPANLPFLFHQSYAIPPADLRKSILTLAVQGKLIPNDPDGKPVGMKLSGGLHGGSSLAPNWRAGLLGDAFNFEYGDNLPGPKRSQSGEYPVYGSNGIVGTHNTYLTKEPAIIVGRKGSAGALNIADGPSWTTDVAYFVRPPRDIDLRFTYYLFSTLRLDDLGKGIKPGLSRKDAYALSIALPPLAEQRRIVAKVEQLMALVDELETQLAASRATAANLLSAFVAELTGSPHNGKLSFPSASTTGSRGRPRKS